MDERSARLKMELVKGHVREGADESARSGVIQATPGGELTTPRPVGPGTVLDGRYLVGEVIGSGAFGLVYEAKNLELDEKVAVKVLRPEIAVDAAMVARFAREAKAAASIKSEYVASVYDVGSAPDGMPYLVMEYLEGRDFGTIVADTGPFGPRAAVEYALQICEALAVAHSKGIVHRDIKPENLLLTERAGGMRIVKVLDFGISKAALTGSIFGNDLPIVKTVNLMGTPLYMSPEQVRCTGGVDVRSDIWSVGIVLYEIIAGAPAFEGASITEICAAILETQPRAIEHYRSDLPSGLVDVIATCLQKNVKQRYQNVAELALALMPFGPKRSRLNVERAVAVLQSVGQVSADVQVESVYPPPSIDSLSVPVIPRSQPAPRIDSPPPPPQPPEPPVASTPPAITAPPVETTPSLATTIGSSRLEEEPPRSPAPKASRAGVAVGVAIALLLLVGGAVALRKPAVQPEPPSTALASTGVASPTSSAASPSPLGASTTAQPTPSPAAQAPAPEAAVGEPHSAGASTAKGASTTAAPTAKLPAWRPPPSPPPPSRPASATASAQAPATTPPPSATPAVTGPPKSATPAETSTGRTFRRQL